MTVLVAAGMFINLSPRAGALQRSEAWLETQCPVTVGRYIAASSSENVKQSYRMPQSAYDTLKPFGIVCRTYSNGEKTFDVVIIASDKAESFHDPRVCFSSQGVDMTDETTDVMRTTARGVIPVTVVTTKSNDAQSVAAYFYRGPGKMCAAPKSLANDMFFRELATGRAQDGVFYRFISEYPGATKADLIEFMQAYVEEAHKTSNGYL